MKILFICRHNRFRSKVAEAIFSKLDCEDEVKGAGAELDFKRLYIAESVKEIMKKRGYVLNEEKSQQVNRFLINWADKIIIVANDVSPEGFPKEKTDVWKIEDTNQEDYEGIERIVGKIEKKVKDLVKRIKKERSL